MSTRSHLVRSVMAPMLAMASLVGVWPISTPARAATPTISVNPTTVLPHGSIQISGSGFDPTTSGHAVSVDIALVNSSGTVPLGILPADGQGNIGGAGVAPLALPFNVDVTGSNQVTATEEGAAGITASTPVAGTLLQPQVPALSAQLGGQVELKGSGFAPRDVVQISLDGTLLSNANGATTTVADDAGAVDVPLVVPQSAQAGTHTLTLTGIAAGAGQHDQASTTLTLSATATTPGPGSTALTLTPNPAAIGTTVLGRASGFQADEPVTFTLKYYDLGASSYAIQNSPATADASGTASALIHIPASADGSKAASVTATGITSGMTFTAPLTFAVLSQLRFDPPTALAGARIVVSGSGFVPNERLFVTTRLFALPATGLGVTDATGAFSATVTILTTAQPGSLVVAVSGSGGDNASANFPVATPVKPALQVNPGTAPAGSKVTVTGQGFGPQEGVAFSLGDTPLGTTSPLSPTDALGVLTATVTLAEGVSPGQYTLIANGQTSGLNAGTPITLTPSVNNHWYFAEGFTGQGPKVFFHETLTLLNYNDKSTRGTLTYQFPDGSTEALPINLKARGLVVEDVNSDVGPNRIVSAVIETDKPIVAQRTITRIDQAKHSLDTDFSPGQSAAQANWYFAEGFSGVTFQPYLTVQNPATVPVSMTVTLYPGSGTPQVVKASIAPFSRYTLNLRSALPGKPFSIRVQADGPVVAERVEYWGDGAGSGKFGAGVKPGVPAPGSTWYFGYGAILGGDEAYISVLNPNTKAAHVVARIFDGTGNAAGTAKVTVKPGQRATLKLNSLLGKHPHSPIAAIVSGDEQIVAEEAQYYGGSPNQGTHAGASIEGRPAPATRWLFASGNTAADQETEYVLNPNATPTTITAKFLGADGQVVQVSYPVKARRVITISANTVPGLHRGIHGSIWTTSGKVKVVVVQVLRGKDGRSALADQGIAG